MKPEASSDIVGALTPPTVLTTPDCWRRSVHSGSRWRRASLRICRVCSVAWSARRASRTRSVLLRGGPAVAGCCAARGFQASDALVQGVHCSEQQRNELRQVDRLRAIGGKLDRGRVDAFDLVGNQADIAAFAGRIIEGHTAQAGRASERVANGCDIVPDSAHGVERALLLRLGWPRGRPCSLLECSVLRVLTGWPGKLRRCFGRRQLFDRSSS